MQFMNRKIAIMQGARFAKCRQQDTGKHASCSNLLLHEEITSTILILIY